ncbi:MAG: RHS repeat-associated core domain-containing protein [Myxococcales bacterium]
MALAVVTGTASVHAQATTDWDYRGRLAVATHGEHTARYFYQHGVDRVLEEHDGSTTYYVGGDFEVRDGIAIVYARLGEGRVARQSRSALQPDLLEDFAPSGRIDVTDAWLSSRALEHASGATPPRANEPVRHLYASARRLLLEHVPSKVFLHNDQLGSLTLASDPGGHLLGELAFQTTGAVRMNRSHVDRYGFMGQRRDPITDLVHLPLRELDARVGRWLSPDPLFLTSAEACLAKPFECSNGYQYVLNNPVDHVDPTGAADTLPWALFGDGSRIALFPQAPTPHSANAAPVTILEELTEDPPEVAFYGNFREGYTAYRYRVSPDDGSSRYTRYVIFGIGAQPLLASSWEETQALFVKRGYWQRLFSWFSSKPRANWIARSYNGVGEHNWQESVALSVRSQQSEGHGAAENALGRIDPSLVEERFSIWGEQRTAAYVGKNGVESWNKAHPQPYTPRGPR